MPACPTCKGQVTCDTCGKLPLDDGDVGSPILPCPKTCSVWVRVLDGNGKAVKGVSLEGPGKTIPTNAKGFGSFDSLEPGKKKVTISLPKDPEDLDKIYKLTEETFRESTVSPGEVKFYNFKVLKKAAPVIDAPEVLVLAVKGARQKIKLKADEKFTGKGKLTCTNGAKIIRYKGAKIEAEPAEFENLTEEGVEIEVEGHEFSDVDGVELKWELIGDLSNGAAATKKLTVVAAALEIYDKSDSKLPNDTGRVVHLQDNKRYSRAKVVLKINPPAYDGEVEITAIGDRLELYDEKDPETGGKKVLSAPIPTGTGKRTEFWAEGIKVSDDAKDTGLILKIPKLAGATEIDKAVFTVVEVRIDLYEKRAKSDVEPVLIPAGQKLDPGRTVMSQGPKLSIQRAKITVHKKPLKAPCKLILKVGKGDDKVTLYPEKGTNKAGKEHTYENSFDNETKLTLPHTLKDDDIKDDKGLIFYVDGIQKSTAKEAEVHLEVESVDEVADAVAFTVEVSSLKITVTRSDGASLDDTIEFTAKDIKNSAEVAKGTIPKTGVHTVELPVDSYLIALKPKNPDEEEMRVFRTNPDTSESALAVNGVTEVEFELRPPYKKIQFIGYWVRTGKYIGEDTREIELDLETTATPAVDWTIAQGNVWGKVQTKVSTVGDVHKLKIAMRGFQNLSLGNADVWDDSDVYQPGCTINAINLPSGDDANKLWLAASRKDLAGRSVVMKEAISEAATNPAIKPGIDPGKDVLKIFMAPEFYYRGLQGAYPFEVLEEILKDTTLDTEIRKSPDYDDWLFVLGSGIGAIPGNDRTDHTGGNVTQSTGLKPAIVTVTFKTGTGGAGVAAGWKFWVSEPTGEFRTQPGVTEFNIDKVTDRGTRNGWVSKELELDGDPVYGEDAQITLWKSWTAYEMHSYWGDTKAVEIVLDCADVPATDWEITSSGITGKVIDVLNTSGNKHTITVDMAGNENLAAGGATVTDLLLADRAGTIDSIESNHVGLKCKGASAGVDPGWRLRLSDPSGTTWPNDDQHDFEIDEIDDDGGDKRRLHIKGEVNIEAGTKFAVWDPNPVYPKEPTKTVKCKVDTGGYTPAAGWALMQGETRGAVLVATKVSGNEYALTLGIPHGQQIVNGAITLAEPGDAEIINIALVTKGGKGAPVSAEGRTMKELLVYKEKISSVDFQSIDYGGQLFYGTVRHMINLHGDQLVRAVPTQGSTDVLGASPQKSGDIVNTRRISEQSITGLGGGTVFTMDKITFGLEVCLDHGAKRLDTYYKTQAQPGEPKVQVQLVPSCGMSLGNYFATANGLAFNVDATHYAAKKTNGADDITKLKEEEITPTDVGKYFAVDDDPKGGHIVVYTAENTPDKGTV